MARWSHGVALGGALAVLASTAALARSAWGPVARQSLAGVVAILAGRVGFLDLYTRPYWYGTAYLLWSPDGGLRLVTAGHLPGYLDGGRWYLWRAIGLRAYGAEGWAMGTFLPDSTRLYPYADTAESTAIPSAPGTGGNVCRSLGTCPAVSHALLLGNWKSLRIGQPLAILGNPEDRWLRQGDHALLQVGTYLGKVPQALELSDNPHFPTVRLPLALALYLPSCRGGDSGSPVITLQGRVVGTLTACGGGTGFAVPLAYPSGLPVGQGRPVPLAGYAPQ